MQTVNGPDAMILFVTVLVALFPRQAAWVCVAVLFGLHELYELGVGHIRGASTGGWTDDRGKGTRAEERAGGSIYINIYTYVYK